MATMKLIPKGAKRTINKVALIILFLIPTSLISSEKYYDISTELMKSTFKIEVEKTIGTVFLMGYRGPTDAMLDSGYYAVLFTAAHVLEAIEADTAKIIGRFLKTGGYRRLPFQIKLRAKGKPLWVRHPDADVAAMYVSIPATTAVDIILYSTDLLATDEMLREFEIRPGDELFVLGFPYGLEANEIGFPILRSGRIASFPITPTSKTKTFLLDFEVFEGNSGGPVFLYSENRFYNSKPHLGIVKFFLGIVSEQLQLPQRRDFIDETIVKYHKLGLAVVVHANYVKEVLKLLPSPPIDYFERPIKIYLE